MACPKCGSELIEEVKSDFVDPNYHVEHYKCNICGTMWVWESTRTLLSEVEAEEPEEFIDRATELRKKQAELIETIRREEEEFSYYGENEE